MAEGVDPMPSGTEDSTTQHPGEAGGYAERGVEGVARMQPEEKEGDGRGRGFVVHLYAGVKDGYTLSREIDILRQEDGVSSHDMLADSGPYAV